MILPKRYKIINSKRIQTFDFSLSESCHKILRFASKHLARQHNNEVNAEDCFNHLWFISDPILRAESGDFGNSKSKSNEIKDGDDYIVESFFIDDIE